MPFLGFGIISISLVIKYPRSRGEGIRRLREAQLVQLQHQPLPTLPSLSLLSRQAPLLLPALELLL